MVWTNIIPLLAEGIQIAILFVAIYGFLYFLRNNRGLQVFVGIIVAAFVLSMILRIKGLQFDVLEHLVDVIINSLFIALIIIFQPELRRALAQLGSFAAWQGKRKRELIVEIVTAASDMARRKCGAIIVIERNTQLQNYIDDAVMLDAKVHYLLLESIFYPKSPLHDGAVIVSGGRIRAAGCILPLSANLNISKELGTRHRAALGMSEAYDSISLVGSEENGYISLASGGVLKRRLSPENLERILCDQLLPKTDTDQKSSIIDWMKGLKKK